MANTITISILSRFNNSGIRSANSQLGTFDSKTKRGLGGVNNLAKGMLGVGTVVATGRFLKGAVDEAREADKASAETAAHIESIGTAANVSVPFIENLASKMSLYSGVADDIIQQGQNHLLTYKNIHNEVGKGNAIFTRATTVALDYARAEGVDVANAHKIVGKALNDPFTGYKKLTRAGVQFTDSEVKKMKAFEKSNDVIGGQKFILEILEEQYAGSAKANADSVDKMNTAWAEFKETLGKQLIPALEKLLPKLTAVIEWMSAHPGTIKAIAVIVGALAVAFLAVFVAANLVAIAIGLAIAAFVALGIFLYSKLDEWKAFWSKHWAEVGEELRTFWEGIKTFFSEKWTEIKEEWMTAWNSIKEFFTGWWSEIGQEANTGASAVKTFVKSRWTEMGQELRTAQNTVKSAWKSHWNEMKQEASTGVSNTVAKVKEIKGKITGFFSGANKWLEKAGKDIMQGLIDGVEWGIDKLQGALARATNMIPDWKGPPSKDKKLLTPAGRSIMEGLIDGIESKEGALRRALQNVTTTIANTSPGLDFNVNGGVGSVAIAGHGNGGGGIYVENLNVTVDNTDSPYEMGKKIKTALDEYERIGGR